MVLGEIRADHGHGLSRLSRGRRLGDVDETVRERHRAQDARALWPGGPHRPSVSVVHAAREHAQPGGLFDAVDQLRLDTRPEELRVSPELEEGRAYEELEGEERRH